MADLSVAFQRITESRVALGLSAAWLLALALGALWPASWWFEVKSVRVADSAAGEPVLMLVDRKIKRPFTGSWSVAIREVSNPSHLMLACSASGRNSYRVDAGLPERLTLGWWTNGRCESLPAGKYVVDTTWTLHLSMLPDKELEAVSSIFEVRK